MAGTDAPRNSRSTLPPPIILLPRHLSIRTVSTRGQRVATEIATRRRSPTPHVRYPAPVRNAVRALVGPGTRVLDIDCGDGTLAGIALAQMAGRYVGLAGRVREVSAGRGAGLDVRLAGPRFPWPVAGETFDVVLALVGVATPSTLDRLLARARGVLRPGGVLVVAVTLTVGGQARRTPLTPARVHAALLEHEYRIRASRAFAAPAAKADGHGPSARLANTTAIARSLLIVASPADQDTSTRARAAERRKSA